MGRKKYKEKLSVDKFDLDDELIRQPQEFFDAAVDAVEANERTGLMKERHEIILARVEQDIILSLDNRNQATGIRYQTGKTTME